MLLKPNQGFVLPKPNLVFLLHKPSDLFLLPSLIQGFLLPKASQVFVLPKPSQVLLLPEPNQGFLMLKSSQYFLLPKLSYFCCLNLAIPCCGLNLTKHLNNKTNVRHESKCELLSVKNKWKVQQFVPSRSQTLDFSDQFLLSFLHKCLLQMQTLSIIMKMYIRKVLYKYWLIDGLIDWFQEQWDTKLWHHNGMTGQIYWQPWVTLIMMFK